MKNPRLRRGIIIGIPQNIHEARCCRKGAAPQPAQAAFLIDA